MYNDIAYQGVMSLLENEEIVPNLYDYTIIRKICEYLNDIGVKYNYTRSDWITKGSNPQGCCAAFSWPNDNNAPYLIMIDCFY